MIYDYQRILSLRLLVWSVASILAGMVLLATGALFWRGFGLQALAWGVIDVLIGGLGLRAALARIDLPFDLNQQGKDARRLKTLLWVNTVLDVLYIALGWRLATTWSHGNPFWVGSGWGIVLQGGFLFVFDLLHALAIPRERFMPRLGLFPSPRHAAFTLEGGKGAVLMVHGFPHSPDEMRPLAEALNQRGWTTRSMLLPGFGPQFDQLFQQRYPGWVRAINSELQTLKKDHQPVVLLGFSLGGGLSLLAAGKQAPDQLILVAPFWWESNRLKDAAYLLARLVMPMDIGLNQKALFRLQRAAESAGIALQGELPEDGVKQAIHNMRVPLIFVEQFLRFSNHIRGAAGSVTSAVVIIQGQSDETVLPRRTRQLASWLPPGARLIEIPGDHFFIQRGNPHLPELIETVAQNLVEQ
ncbi:MAG: alpha/beta fold hydrolase [Anaerolineae bacterium]|nr:alpha/beta fold hydrolase [Anaerolineae bacterium]